MPIPDIGLRTNSLPSIGIDVAPSRQELLMPRLPPGVSMSLPVVNMPGCVEAHVDSELQTGLTTSDPDRVAIYCDSGMPSFKPMSFQPNRLKPPVKDQLPKIGNTSPETPEPPGVPVLPIPPQPLHTANTSKSSAASKPRCEEDEFLKDGECIAVEQPATPVFVQVAEKYLPPLEAATTTATIATIATVSALLAKPAADFLLKLIKPMIKKIIGKIKKAMGKKVRPRSVRERVLAQRSRNRLLRQARDLMG